MDRGLNVCLMNDSFPPLIDGVANAVANYARVIEAVGGRPAVATPEYHGARDSYSFPVVRYPSFNTTRLVGYRTGYPFDLPTLNCLKKYNFDIIHSHCPLVSTLLARTLREMTGAPIVFTYHTKFDIDIKRAINAKLIRQAAIKVIVNNIASCDEVWVVSRGAGENLRSLGYEGDYTVMSNGVDLPKGRPDESVIDAVKAQYRIEEGVPLFLFVGRIMWYKGLKLIIDALKMMKAASLPFRMLFAGDGTDRAEVEAYAKGQGVEENCTFTGAVHDRETIRALYSAADFFLFPSTFDTNGLVVREAAACGLGSLLIKGSCAAEDISDGETGVLVGENAVSVFEKLRELSACPEMMKKIGENAQDRLYTSWDESVTAAYNRYWTVLDNSRIGESRRKETRIDELFTLESEWTEFFGKIYDSFQSVRENHGRRNL